MNDNQILEKVDKIMIIIAKLQKWIRSHEAERMKIDDVVPRYSKLLSTFIQTVKDVSPDKLLYKHIPKWLCEDEQKMLQNYVRWCIQLWKIDDIEYECYLMYLTDKQCVEYFAHDDISWFYDKREYTNRGDIKKIILTNKYN